MATNVKLNTIVYDRTESEGDYPYTTTMFATDTDTGDLLNTSATNVGLTADDEWPTFVISEAEWALSDPDE